MITNVYIDGFNLYYRAVQGTKYKWLDVSKLAQEILPDNKINRIIYCTARVSGKGNDPRKPERQNVYLRALRTIPNLTIVYGKFRNRQARRKLVKPIGNITSAEVHYTEEKGSDVSIAAHMILDACRNDYEVAVVISNDSDLMEPIKMVQDEFGLGVVVLNPDRNPKSHNQFRNVVSSTIVIREKHLKASQFPATIRVGKGKVIRKPKTW